MISFDSRYFDPEKIYLSGQVLIGWEDKGDGSYSVRSLGKKAGLRKFPGENGSTVTQISCPDSDNPFWTEYFDLSTDYEKIEQQADSDEYLREALEYGRGIRILRQNIWETLFSFIVSQNNNIPRITKTIRTIEEKCGGYADFETLYENRGLLKDCGLGYRDAYLDRLVTELHEGTRSLDFSADTDTAYKQLLDIHGVGPKVADCVLLFGLHRMERCPVDTWMKKIFEIHYNGRRPEWVNSEYAGYYQQVTFFYERGKHK